MNVDPSLSLIGALIGVPARANIMSVLMDGRAQTATELAYYAGVTPQTASSHLAKLTDAKLLTVEKQGRHRYYRLAGPAIAEALEPLSVLIDKQPRLPLHRSKALEELRAARMCYDHLAGRLGAALAQAMTAERYLLPGARDFELTAAGAAFFDQLHIDVGKARGQRRCFARQCLDWSERRHHLGGALGAALAARLLELKWLQRDKGRKVVLTAAGKRGLARLLPGLAAESAALSATA